MFINVGNWEGGMGEVVHPVDRGHKLTNLELKAQGYVPKDAEVVGEGGTHAQDALVGFTDLSGFTYLTNLLLKHKGDKEGTLLLEQLIFRMIGAISRPVVDAGGSILSQQGDAIEFRLPFDSEQYIIANSSAERRANEVVEQQQRALMDLKPQLEEIVSNEHPEIQAAVREISIHSTTALDYLFQTVVSTGDRNALVTLGPGVTWINNPENDPGANQHAFVDSIRCKTSEPVILPGSKTQDFYGKFVHPVQLTQENQWRDLAVVFGYIPLVGLLTEEVLRTRSPEDAIRLVNVLRDTGNLVFEEFEGLGGIVDKLGGSKYMGYFGPRIKTLQQSVKSAIRSSLNINQGLQGVFENHKSFFDQYDISIDVEPLLISGITLDQTFLVHLTTDHLSSLTIYGAAVNLAARLMQGAVRQYKELPDDDKKKIPIVSATEDVTRFDDVRNRSVVVPQGSHKHKGFDEEIPTVGIFGEKGVNYDDSVYMFPHKYIGHEKDIASLDSLFEVSSDGSQSFVVRGDAGSGKTRFWKECISRHEDIRVLETEALSHRKLAYLPIQKIIQKLGVDFDEMDVEYKPFLAQFFFDRSPYDLSDYSREERINGVHKGLEYLLSYQFVEKKTLLMFEDLHWADNETILAFNYLKHNLHNSNVVIGATVRSPEGQRTASKLGKGSDLRIRLASLGKRDSSSLFDEVVGDREHDVKVKSRILDIGEGNPFLIEQIVEYWDSHFEALGGLEHFTSELVVPRDVRGVIAARIDELSPEEQKVLRYAAVIGTTFTDTTLRKLLGDYAPEDFERILTSLRDKRFIDCKERAPGEWRKGEIFKFAHELYREVGESQIGESKGALHRLTSSVFEGVYSQEIKTKLDALRDLVDHVIKSDRPIEGLHHIKKLAYFRAKDGYYDDAIQLHEAIEKFCLQDNSQSSNDIVIFSYLARGVLFGADGDYRNSWQWFDKADDMARKNGNWAVSLSAVTERGRFLSRKGYEEKSIRDLQAAAAMLGRATTDYLDHAHTNQKSVDITVQPIFFDNYRNRGITFVRMYDLTKDVQYLNFAEKCFVEAESFIKGKNDSDARHNQVRSLNTNYAELLLRRGDATGSVEDYETAFVRGLGALRAEGRQGVSSELHAASVMGTIAKVALRLEWVEAAKSYIGEVKDVFARRGGKALENDLKEIREYLRK
jgi:class 3 adenylate cyclase/tetratricopeptide (TPR) repeat protein